MSFAGFLGNVRNEKSSCFGFCCGDPGGVIMYFFAGSGDAGGVIMYFDLLGVGDGGSSVRKSKSLALDFGRSYKNLISVGDGGGLCMYTVSESVTSSGTLFKNDVSMRTG